MNCIGTVLVVSTRMDSCQNHIDAINMESLLPMILFAFVSSITLLPGTACMAKNLQRSDGVIGNLCRAFYVDVGAKIRGWRG